MGIFSFGIFYAQIVFIALTIWVLLLISWVSFDAARDALRENANNEQNFTKLERILLFPFLVLIFPLNKVVSYFGPKKSKTKVMPTSPMKQYLTVKIIGGPMDKGVSWDFNLKEQDQIYLGTDENENDIVLEDDDVDAEHAALCWDEKNNQFLFMDRYSDGTSKVNGNVVDCKTPVEVKTGDKISLGSNTILVVSLTAELPPSWQLSSKIKIKKKALNKDVVKNWEAAEQLRNPKDVFKQFDLDNDGGLAPDEVRGALNYLGCEMSDTKFAKFFAKCDKNKDGTLCFKEFKKSLYVCERGCWCCLFNCCVPFLSLFSFLFATDIYVLFMKPLTVNRLDN